MARLAIAVAVASGLLTLPALALARGEPRAFHGTLEITKTGLPRSLPQGSSASFRFHALYTIHSQRV
ncbi:MAG: hypothetical protein QOH90_2231, partial [Actinomycetota bacterium]|nr:hypothetical protein [Actinomycetota bacterium]